MSLYIYRNTSDHHTNLNKIFHFTILMIVCYGLFLLCVDKINYYIIDFDFYYLYIILNFSLLFISMFIVMLNDKKINLHSTQVIMLSCAIFMLITFFLQDKSHIIFGILFYISLLFFFYHIFKAKANLSVAITKSSTYVALIMVLIFSPELINPTLNIFNKENIENKNLSKELIVLDYDTLSNLTRLSFRDYNIENNVSFSESNIVNQKEIIIANKDTLEKFFGFLLKRNADNDLNKILKDPNDLNLSIPKNRSIALNFIFAADGKNDRTLYDMEINDNFRLRFNLADENEIKREIKLLRDYITNNINALKKLQPIIEKQEIYLDIYRAIRLDKINSQIYKTTYILYIIIMILCVYSLTKTARKNSVTT